MSLSEEQTELKSKTSEESVEENCAGVKSYNKKFQNFILALM